MNAATTSHTVELENPLSASLVVKMPRIPSVVIAMITNAPIGNGRDIRPLIVAAKMQSKPHALASKSPWGQIHIPDPTANGTNHRHTLFVFSIQGSTDALEISVENEERPENGHQGAGEDGGASQAIFSLGNHLCHHLWKE